MVDVDHVEGHGQEVEGKIEGIDDVEKNPVESTGSAVQEPARPVEHEYGHEADDDVEKEPGVYEALVPAPEYDGSPDYREDGEGEKIGLGTQD